MQSRYEFCDVDVRFYYTRLIRAFQVIYRQEDVFFVGFQGLLLSAAVVFADKEGFPVGGERHMRDMLNEVGQRDKTYLWGEDVADRDLVTCIKQHLN